MTDAAAAPRADVVVVTYNPGDTIDSFLASLREASTGRLDVVVADNASRDGTADRIAASKIARVVQTGRNAGYGDAANEGAATGSAPWILISNADIIVAPGAIDRMIEVGESDPRIGMVGPLVRELDGSVYPSARPLPSVIVGAGHAALGRIWPGNPFTRRYRVPLDPQGGERDAGWLSGSCFLIRRSVWEQLGGFDEGFFMFFEDVDLGRRVGKAGYRNVWTPRAEVTHIGGHTWRSDPAPMLSAHHASAARYVKLVYPHWWQAPIRAAAASFLKARQRAEIAAARARLYASGSRNV